MTKKKDSETGKTGAGSQDKPDDRLLIQEEAARALVLPILKAAKTEAAKVVKVAQVTAKDLRSKIDDFARARQLYAEYEVFNTQLAEVRKHIDAFVPGLAELRSEAAQMREELWGDGRYVNGVFIPKAANNSERGAAYDLLKAQIREAEDKFMKPLEAERDARFDEAKISGALALIRTDEAERKARRTQTQSSTSNQKETVSQ